MKRYYIKLSDTAPYNKVEVAAAENTVIVDNSDAKFTTSSTNINFGIGSNISSYKFCNSTSTSYSDIYGKIAYITSVNTSSDRRLKDDIKPADPEMIKKSLNLGDLKSFRYKSDDTRSYGRIAQEIESIVPEVVGYNEDGYASVNYTALHELQIQGLIDKVAELENEIISLKSQLRKKL